MFCVYSPGTITSSFFFFFNDTATTEIYTLSLHDALPISRQNSRARERVLGPPLAKRTIAERLSRKHSPLSRSEEHTSELQSQSNLVCRLLLEKKKKNITTRYTITTPELSTRRPHTMQTVT